MAHPTLQKGKNHSHVLLSVILFIVPPDGEPGGILALHASDLSLFLSLLFLNRLLQFRFIIGSMNSLGALTGDELLQYYLSPTKRFVLIIIYPLP